jgi:probable phosphomutase (TIGR03848 family)
MTTLYLVRHAVTEQTGKKLSGWMEDIPLSDQGRAEAEAVADRLADQKLDAIYSSPIDRTLQTAQPIAARHDLGITTSKALGEVEYGKWTDRSLKVLARTKLWAQVQRWPSAARFPDGETLREVQVRVVGEVERIVEEHPKGRICVVSHGDPIKLICAHYLGVHIDLFQRIVVAPASVSVLSISGAGPYVLALNSLTGPIPSE